MVGADHKPWVEWSPPSAAQGTMVRSLLTAVFGLHSSYQDEIWLWRGEANASHVLEPGMHTRVRSSGSTDGEAATQAATAELIRLARESRLDELDGVRLPDLALLAHLQHHGAATPLLDVSVDPFVALWMVANAAGDNVNGDDDKAGRLVAIKRPAPSRWLDPFDSTPYARTEGTSIDSRLVGSGLHWFRPPDVSERLRIQRGSFVLGRFDGDSTLTTLPISIGAESGTENWLSDRIEALGKRGRPASRGSEAVQFRVIPSLKPALREWLVDRAGLSREVIYPTPWNRPHVEVFSRAYGRRRDLDPVVPIAEETSE